METHRDSFFLATKTGERTSDGAAREIGESLERLRTDHLDHIQLHNLVEPEEWETAFAPGGALEAVVEAKEQGLVSHIGVTGHGVTVAAQHLRSLERYPFDSVLLPYNFAMSQQHRVPGRLRGAGRGLRRTQRRRADDQVDHPGALG